MENLRPADLILARRTLLNDSETFDLLIHEDNYYRIVLTNYYNDNKVVLKTNISDFTKEPLFEYSSTDELLDALFIQAKFIFESFIEQEYIARDNDFDVEVIVIDVTEEIVALDKARNILANFISDNKIEERFITGEDIEAEDSELHFELERVADEFNMRLGVLDEIFIDENILDELTNVTYTDTKMN